MQRIEDIKSSNFSTIEENGERNLANAVFTLINDNDHFLTFNYQKTEDPNTINIDIEETIITTGKQYIFNNSIAFHIEAMIKYQQCQESKENHNGIKSFKHSHSITHIYKNKLSDSFKNKLQERYTEINKESINTKVQSNQTDVHEVVNIVELLYKQRYRYFVELNKSGNPIREKILQPQYNTSNMLALLIALYETTGLEEKRGIVTEHIQYKDGLLSIPM